MPTRNFHPPVLLQTDRPGQSFAVSNVEKAAELLLEWHRRELSWRAAVVACMTAMRPDLPNEQAELAANRARAAFAKAARDAGILIKSEARFAKRSVAF